jgi:uncharacterized protein
MLQRVAIALTLMLFPLTSAFSQPSFDMPQSRITVSGSAEVKVVPDVVYLQLGVETRDVTLESAKRQNDKRIEDVLKFLRKKGVPDKNIQTDFISVEPEFNSEVSRIKPTNYVVRKSVEVKLTDLRRFEEIMGGVLDHGITHVHGIDFRTSELRKYRDQARAMAARAAKEKADALASELGARRGKVLSINEGNQGGWWTWSGSGWGAQSRMMSQNALQNAMQSDRGGDSEDATMSVGQISVSATVNASFAIE